MSYAAQILKKARAVIEDPKNWTTGKYATTADDYAVAPWAPTACRFCMIGALAKALDVSPAAAENSGPYKYLERAVNPEKKSVAAYNDSYSHREVLKLFDRAIELAEWDAK